MNHTAKFRTDCNRLNTMSQENRHDIGEWGVNNCWVSNINHRNTLGSTVKYWRRFYHFCIFPIILPFQTSIAPMLRHKVMQSRATLWDRVFIWELRTWIMRILHIVHTNSLPGGWLYKRVHPAKEIDLTAVKMIRHIRRSLAFFLNCKLRTVHL